MESESISHFRLDLLSLLLNGDSALALTDVSALDLLPLVFDDGDSASALTLTAALTDGPARDLLLLVLDGNSGGGSALTDGLALTAGPASALGLRITFGFGFWSKRPWTDSSESSSSERSRTTFAGIPIAAAVASLTALEAVAVTPIAVSAASTSSWSKTPV